MRWFRQDDLLWRVPVHKGDGTALVVGYSEPDSSYVVHRIADADGGSVWSRTLAVGGYGAPASTGETAAVLTDHVGVALLDWADGRQLGLYRVDARIRSAVSVFEDAYAFSAASSLWLLEPGRGIRAVADADGVVLFGEVARVGTTWVSMYVRQVEHGSGMVGVTRLGPRGWQTDLAPSPVASSDTSGVVVKDGLLYVGAGRFVFAVDVESGAVVWRTSVPGFATRSMVALGDDRLFVADSAGHLTAVALEDGETLWSRPISREGFWSPPSATSTTVLAIAGGALLVVDADSGQTRQLLPVGHSPYSAVTVSPAGTLMVGGGDPPYHGLLLGLEDAAPFRHSELVRVFDGRWRIESGEAWDSALEARSVDASMFGQGEIAFDSDRTMLLDTGRMTSGTYAVPVTLSDGSRALTRFDLGPGPALPEAAHLDVEVEQAVDPLHSGAAILSSLLAEGSGDQQRRVRADAERILAVSERQPWDLWRLAARQVLHDPPEMEGER